MNTIVRASGAEAPLPQDCPSGAGGTAPPAFGAPPFAPLPGFGGSITGGAFSGSSGMGSVVFGGGVFAPGFDGAVGFAGGAFATVGFGALAFTVGSTPSNQLTAEPTSCIVSCADLPFGAVITRTRASLSRAIL